GRIRRLHRIRQWCQMPDATLAASYQAYKFPHHPATVPMPDATLAHRIRPGNSRAIRRPDKAFTPHPAMVPNT
ncbi:hypothetical protein, partial [Escherichia marmotae]|uniref:hypothetical protein n=2 Tax=Enterobacteriaceae TaxID=543 RepID=UPI001A9C9BF9